jgi:hypothetical protein
MATTWTPFGWHKLPARDTPINPLELEAFGQYIFDLAVEAAYPSVDTAVNGGISTLIGLTAVDLFVANPSRIEAGFRNYSQVATLFYRLGTTATASNGIPVPPLGRIVIPNFKERISVISDTASTDVRSWEL